MKRLHTARGPDDRGLARAGGELEMNSIAVPLRAELRSKQGNVVHDLIDTNGRTFNSAGDLGRLVTDVGGPMRYIHPYGQTLFDRGQCPDLLADIDQLATRNNVTPVEQRGLDRLRVMTERCRDSDDDVYLWFIGG